MSHPATLKSAVLSATASGDNTAVAASAGKAIRIHGIVFTTDGANTVTFKDGTPSGTALSGAFNLTGSGSALNFPPSDEPYFTTTVGNAFILNASGTSNILGTIWYNVG